MFERFISSPVTKKRKKYECQISGLIKLTLQLSRVGMSLMFTGHEVTSVRNSLVRHFCLRSEIMSFLHTPPAPPHPLPRMCDNLVHGYLLVRKLFNWLFQQVLNRTGGVSTQAIPPKLDNSI